MCIVSDIQRIRCISVCTSVIYYHLRTNSSYKIVVWIQNHRVVSNVMISIWRQIKIWSRIQNKIRSLQDLIPLFSSGLWSFIASDSWNANFNQLSDFLRIFVFSRTAFIWNCIRSTSLPKISNKPTMSLQYRHWWKCLLIAPCLSNQPCSFVWLKSVDSVFPM